MQRPGAARVSVLVKRVVIVGVLGAVALVVWYMRRSDTTLAATSATGEPRTTAPAPDPARAGSPGRRPPAHVTRLSADERRQVADQIATAQATRYHATPPRPSLAPLGEAAAPSLKTSIRDAMREAHPYLVDCYEQALPTLPHPYVRVTAKMTLTGDPDVGTLIDAEQLVDDTGQPVPAKFDDCLRTTFQSLELPPLSEGDVVKVHYPFVFDVKPNR